jgi:hypothetical protein
MTDEELSTKNALYDRLLKEGIDGREEEDALKRTQ